MSPTGPDSPGADSPGAARGGGFVRQAREADAASLARVQVMSWRCGYAGIVPDALLTELTGDEAETVWRDRWREAIGNPPTSRHRVLVAVEQALPRAVVGFVSAGPATDADRWPGTDGELYELRVTPEQTGHGHGSRLLHAAADTLAQDGFHTVAMWVLAADSALRQFLESAGWAADGARSELDVGVAVPALRLHTRIGE
ncbi:MAG TPA: GNAT family N-acetyltransferase [Streptosporangiaceae bacterium]|nr:GNAT family N-acetyltransferase [Streptosporangiaceae bacterium]